MKSLCLFSIYMDECIREIKVGVWGLRARLNVIGRAFGGGVLCR